MKKSIVCLILIIISSSAYAQELIDLSRNGEIIQRDFVNGEIWTYRIHLQVAQISEAKSLSIYDRPSFTDSIIIQTLRIFEKVTISKIVIQENKDLSISLWLYINTSLNISGWIYAGNRDPYASGIGEVKEIIKIGERLWTIREIISDTLIPANRLNVRDMPGLIGTKILFQIRKEDYSDVVTSKKWGEFYYGIYVTIFEITDEYDNIAGKLERWVKIRDRTGREGWVFGGYLEQGEIGGPKYHTSSSIILLEILPP